MKLIGLDLGKNRTPFQNMTDAEETAMKAELEAIHFFEVVVSISENKGEPSLEPDRLVCVQQRTVPVQTSEVASVLMIDTVFQPERQNVGQ